MRRLETAETARRRAVILLVVLALLTLFAIVGLAFVFYAQKEHTASVHWRESNLFVQTNITPGAEVDIDLLKRFAFGKMLYDEPDDVDGASSAIRGHSFARNMYGYNEETLNNLPFNGTGRLHYQSTQLGNQDDYFYVNYTYFQNDGFCRDPERIGARPNPSAARPNSPYTGGCNAPYTYPDLNSMFLGASRANGDLLMPAFHRPWLIQQLMASGVPANSPLLKYAQLRPFGDDAVHPTLFPQLPPGATGDIRNRPYGTVNDSIWMDLNFPVQTSFDGRKFKPLFAIYTEDLDNKLNLNAHGNLRVNLGGGMVQNWLHASHQGWGKWEVNPGQVLTANPGEYRNLFIGNGNTRGRYGNDLIPGPQDATRSPLPSLLPLMAPWPTQGTPLLSLQPRSFAQMDYDAVDDAYNPTNTAGSPPQPPFRLPIAGEPPFPSFTGSPGGFENEVLSPPGSVRSVRNHPEVYDYFRPTGDDRGFPQRDPREEMRYLLEDPYTQAEVAQMVPNSLAALQARLQVTTLSMDLARPGMFPWIYDRNAPTNTYAIAGPDQGPVGPPLPFPNPLGPDRSNPPPGNGFSDFDPDAGAVRSSWRAQFARAGKFNLDRIADPRFAYPHQLPTAGGVPNPVADNGFINPMSMDEVNQFRLAHQHRQDMAREVYRRLLLVTGARLPAVNAVNPAGGAMPDPADLAALETLRWLGQLAVNIVDYIDADDINTPFNFYRVALETFGVPGLMPTDGVANVRDTNDPNEKLPSYWVFGTELPSVVLSEVMTEYQLPPDSDGNSTYDDPGMFEVKVWAELHCPFPHQAAPPTNNTQAQDGQPVRLYANPTGTPGMGYSVYRVQIADAPQITPTNPNVLFPGQVPGTNDNVTGAPNQLRSLPTDFAQPMDTVKTIDGTDVPVVVNPDPMAGGGYFLVGPSPDRDETIAPPGGGAMMRGRVPGKVPFLQSPSMKYQVNKTAPDTWDIDDRPDMTDPMNRRGVTVLLRRLANPFLPPDPALVDGMGNVNLFYNPYITVDYIEGAPLNNASPDLNMGPNPGYRAVGKKQPYAVGPMSNPPQPQTDQLVEQFAANPGNPAIHHTLGLPNVFPDNTGMAAAPPVIPDWLVHLDRKVISPAELLFVSAHRPHELTHAFRRGGTPHSHRANWMDEVGPSFAPLPPGTSTRLYRLLSLLHVADRAAGISPQGRTPGMININTIWEPGVFAALCDASPSNRFTPADVLGLNSVYSRMLQRRTPGLLAGGLPMTTGGQITPMDRPFLPFSAQHLPQGDPQAQYGMLPPTNLSRGADDTLFASVQGSGPPLQRIFHAYNSNTSGHPYFQNELLTKIHNNVTYRSNVFAVWLTVGFFEVVKHPTTNRDVLGAEIVSPRTNQPLRHRFFAVVDRTQFVLAPEVVRTANAMNGSVTQTHVPVPVRLDAALPAFNPTGTPPPDDAPNKRLGLGFLQHLRDRSAPLPNKFINIPVYLEPGMLIVIDRGNPDEETVVVEDVDVANRTFTATFVRTHGQNARITIPGNPGPQETFDENDELHKHVVGSIWYNP